MFWMLAMFTLFTIPFMDFLSNYHIILWWPSLLGFYYSISC